MARFAAARGHELRYTYDNDRDGRSSFRIGLTAMPCPGVVLRFNAVIDCTLGEDPMPPVTIDFLKNLAAELQPVAAGPQSDGGSSDAAPRSQVAGHFTCDSGDFILSSQLQRVEEMVTAAGLPGECAPSVEGFCSLSARSATNTFWKAVTITVEAGAPGSLVDDDDEEEVVPAGAAIGECPICYMIYLVGGATSVKLPCSHTFHRKCLDRWTSVRPTCPYCLAPVPEELHYLDEEDDISGLDASASEQPSSTWSRICRTAVIVLFILAYVILLTRIW
ncbi:uncharacterized protein LOC133922976 [Phragmites australis]|uniref:uncharacterized protein LOC133922976 n=1 Tax=Phragmites australis TaxID=29695 RepID=UPI002D78B063|nr:uncharacterized protein LOC133922976 [Phragmites australis]